MHALGFRRQTIRHRSTPSKPNMQLLGAAQSSIMRLLTLTFVCELMTMTASEDPATVQDGYAPTASPCRT
jgi:hypothetical protein